MYHFPIYILLTLSLFGCATGLRMYSAQSIDLDMDISLPPNDVLIYGRILFRENGELQIPYGFQTRPWWSLSGTGTSEAVPGKVERMTTFLRTQDSGIFLYIIPAGYHEVTQLEPFYYVPVIRPALKFEATEPGVAYYLGDLEVDYDSSRWLGGLWGNYIHNLNYLEVVDRYDEVRSEVLDILGDRIELPLGKSLMHRIRGQFPRLEEEEGGFIFMGSPGSLKFGK